MSTEQEDSEKVLRDVMERLARNAASDPRSSPLALPSLPPQATAEVPAVPPPASPPARRTRERGRDQPLDIGLGGRGNDYKEDQPVGSKGIPLWMIAILIALIGILMWYMYQPK